MQFIRSKQFDAQQLPAILTGPVVADALGIPRYAATIWIDFLHGDLAVHTRSAYRRAAAALYDQAAQCAPAVDLDLALLGPDLSEVERVLSAFVLRLQIKSGVATTSQWRLARSFVFDFLRFSEVDTDAMRKRLLEIEQRFRRLRPQAPRPPAPVRALPAEVIEDLHEIFHPSSQRNPYRTEPIRSGRRSARAARSASLIVVRKVQRAPDKPISDRSHGHGRGEGTGDVGQIFEECRLEPI